MQLVNNFFFGGGGGWEIKDKDLQFMRGTQIMKKANILSCNIEKTSLITHPSSNILSCKIGKISLITHPSST